VTIEVLNESGTELDVAGLAKLARFALEELKVHRLAELCIKAVDIETMAQLNEQWMGHPGPTDVLAFPMDELRPGAGDDELEDGVLGDLVLCPQVAQQQAHQAGHPIRAELELLTVHGILHLLGYDHAKPEEHKEMFALQAGLLNRWLESSRQ
jgi:probable rRNA maturation factor